MGGMTRTKSSFSIRVSIVDGVSASNNIAISGIKTSDELVHVDHFTSKASIASVADDTANCSITSAGNIQSTTDTSSNLLRVFWLDNSPAPGSVQSKNAFNLQFSFVDGAMNDVDIAITGIQTDDTIVHISHFTTKVAIESLLDLTSEGVILTDGNIQLDSTDTSSDLLLVIWISNSGPLFTRTSGINFKIEILAGSTAVNDIAVSGIATSDSILHCSHISITGTIATMVDITSEVEITSAGNIQLSTTSTSGDTLWLVWVDNSA